MKPRLHYTCRVPKVRTIVFVCEHGAAKSVIAAALLERLAREQRAPLRALARGTEPDPHLSSTAAAGLLAEGIDVRTWQPRRLTSDELDSAWRIVSFGPDLSSIAANAPVERWHDVPPVSKGFAATRAAILTRIPRLLEDWRDGD